MRRLSNSRGFTLIELLVVISIIAILSSVVLASLNNARQKGTIGAGQQFSGYNYHYLGVNALAIYDFNDYASGAKALDSSINNLTLNLVSCSSSPYCRTSQTVSGSGYAFTALKSTQYGYTTPNSTTIKEITISVWVNPDATWMAQGNAGIIAMISSGSPNGPGNMIIGVRSGSIQVESSTNIFYNNGSTSGYNCASTLPGVQAGIWQNITFSVNTSGNGSAYLNGKLVGSLSGCTGLPFSPQSISVGSGDSVGDYSFTGYIDDLYIYSQALSLNQVHELYAMGAAKHGLAVSSK